METGEVTTGASDVTGEVTAVELLTEVNGVVTELVVVADGRLVAVVTGLVSMGDNLLVVIATASVTVVSDSVTLVWLKHKIKNFFNSI